MNVQPSPFVNVLIPRNAFALEYLLIQIPPAVKPAAAINRFSTVTPCSSLRQRVLWKRIRAIWFRFPCFLVGFIHISSLHCKWFQQQIMVNADGLRFLKNRQWHPTVWMLAGRHRGGYLAFLYNSSGGENEPGRKTLTRFWPCATEVLQYPCKSRR